MKKAVRLEVQAPRGALEGTAREEFTRRFHVALNVLRGRLTPSGAWYLMDISGASRRVEALIRLFRERGLAIRTHSIEASFT